MKIDGSDLRPTQSHSLNYLSPSLDMYMLVNSSQLRRIVPISTTTLWRWVKEGLLPKPIKFKGQNFWRLNEVIEVIDRL